MICVMQPYFAPYGGYFQLFAFSETFVLLDCVQFPRRGWVHRNQLPQQDGRAAWLTVPLQPAPRDATIDTLRLAADAGIRLANEARRFPSLEAGLQRGDSLAQAVVRPTQTGFVDYAETILRMIADRLGFSTPMIRSSRLEVPASFRGQDRILEIARRLGADSYLNPSGGRDLYDPADFAAAGVDLNFLQPYPGPTWSLLHRLMVEPAEAIAAEIRATPPQRAVA